MKHPLKTASEFLDWTTNATPEQYYELLETQDKYYGVDLYEINRVSFDAFRYRMSMEHNIWLMQELELKHLLRVGEDGEVLEEPKGFEQHEHQSEVEMQEIGAIVEVWEKAGEDLIFKEAYIKHNSIMYKGVFVGHNLYLKGWEFGKFKTIGSLLEIK